jgi:hypothetical protein
MGYLEKVAFVLADGTVKEAKEAGGNLGYGIELPKDKPAPVDVQITWKWFNLHETEVFPVDRTIFAESRIERADAGAPPAPTPPKPLDEGKGKGLRGTYLTWKELKHAPQPFPGFWQDTGNDVLVRFNVSRDGRNMVIDDVKKKDTWWGKLKNQGKEWRGRVWTTPAAGPWKGKVHHLTPAAMKASSDNTRFTGRWSGRRTDDETGQLTDDPTNGRMEYTRVVGTTFAEIRPGKYIYLLAVVAPARFKAMVRLSWDFAKVDGKRVRLTCGELLPKKWDIHNPKFDPFSLTEEELEKLSDPKFIEQLEKRAKRTQQQFGGPKGFYDFVTERPGTYEFKVQVLDAAGQVMHTDYAKAVIPALR